MKRAHCLSTMLETKLFFIPSEPSSSSLLYQRLWCGMGVSQCRRDSRCPASCWADRRETVTQAAPMPALHKSTHQSFTDKYTHTLELLHVCTALENDRKLSSAIHYSSEVKRSHLPHTLSSLIVCLSMSWIKTRRGIFHNALLDWNYVSIEPKIHSIGRLKPHINSYFNAADIVLVLLFKL